MELERKLEGAMDQLKIINLDLRFCTDRKTLVRETVSRIQERIEGNDKAEFDRIMKGTRVDILGKGTTLKKTEDGRIHTVPVLITCGCRNMKERMEKIVRIAELFASFQWPKECMDFVNRVREKVETIGLTGRNTI
jgi:hypothetical protein